LVDDPQALLERLARLRLPLSVWWEHAPNSFPRIRHSPGLLGFNLSFGASAGLAVGKHLAEQGRLEVAFLSPFHGNEWSPARLQGLREAIDRSGGTVLEFVDPRYASPWDLRNLSGGEEGMRSLLRESLEGFLQDPRLRATPTWVLVNDLAAVELFGLLRERKASIPHVIGFDNGSDSERIGFDSFEFHTDGMVRQMLHHIAHPKAALFAGPPVHEMLGRLVVRSTEISNRRQFLSG
jgi:DNA-binding LacI/PurR family transcriptional regulator